MTSFLCGTGGGDVGVAGVPDFPARDRVDGGGGETKYNTKQHLKLHDKKICTVYFVQFFHCSTFATCF